ncbi:MAG TPA: hypothetical protein VF823_12560, partial [Anaerolineales bacterium]
WVVGGIQVKVNPNTSIQGEPELGSQVWVSGVLLEDGSIQSLQIQASGNPPEETNEATAQPSSTSTTQVEEGQTPESGESDTPKPEDTKQPPALTNPHATPTPENIMPSPTQEDHEGDSHPSATPGLPANVVTPTPTRED